MIKKITLLFVLVALLVPLASASAQAPAPVLLGSTKPLADDLKSAMLQFLEAYPPIEPAPKYYWISNVTFVDVGVYRVSVVAFELTGPDDEYHMEAWDKIRWWNSLELRQLANDDIQVSYLYPEAQASKPAKTAKKLYAGGGSGVWFPWESGKSVIFGTLGVHDTGYAGTRFVDFVSGDALGPNAARPYVYASTASTIVAVCDDGQTVGVRMQSSGGGEYYSYYHLLPGTLAEGQTFARGQLLGTLKYGSFPNLGCGYASQQPTNYHLHWGFQPSGGQFRAEDCILSLEKDEWTCNHNGVQKTVKPNQWLWHAQGGTDSVDLPNDPGGNVTPESAQFWDMVLIGMYETMDAMLISTLPKKAAFDAAASLARTSMLVVRMFYVLVRSIFDIRLAINIFLVIGLVEMALALYALYRLVLKAIPGAS